MGQRCLIWGTSAEVGHVGRRDMYWVESPRAGGRYKITGSADAMIENGCLDAAAKARLTTVLIDRRRDGEHVPIVDSTLLEETKETPLLPPAERAARLLKHIAARESSAPGHQVILGHPISPEALAYSESWNDGQINTLLEYLEAKRWLTVQRSLDGIECTVTVLGHEPITGENRRSQVREAFVAMWFDEQMNDAYEMGIKPAIRDAGFVPIRIDEKKDANRIDDDILNAITQSRFVVADMTHGSDGVRGSVYFEAGFAHGFGLDVIYCCRRDCIDRLPFDTRQYHHIVWDTPTGLRAELAERIRARIESSDSDAKSGAPAMSASP